MRSEKNYSFEVTVKARGVLAPGAATLTVMQQYSAPIYITIAIDLYPCSMHWGAYIYAVIQIGIVQHD